MFHERQFKLNSEVDIDSKHSASQAIHIELLKNEICDLRDAERALLQRLHEADAHMAAAKMEHDSEIQALRQRLCHLADAVRRSAQEQQDAAKADQESMSEIYRQLAAATKIISALRAQLAALTAENQQLRSRQDPQCSHLPGRDAPDPARPADSQGCDSSNASAGPTATLSVPQRPGAAERPRAVQGDRPGPAEAWWSGVAADAEALVGRWELGGAAAGAAWAGGCLSEGQLLERISRVYAEKIVQVGEGDECAPRPTGERPA